MDTYTNSKLDNFNKEISNKKVAIIGLGVSNMPLIDYFRKLNCIISVFDNREENKIDKDTIDDLKDKNINYYFGENSLSNLVGFDYIFRSPSCMPYTKELQEEKNRGAKITSEIEKFVFKFP